MDKTKEKLVRINERLIISSKNSEPFASNFMP